MPLYIARQQSRKTKRVRQVRLRPTAAVKEKMLRNIRFARQAEAEVGRMTEVCPGRMPQKVPLRQYPSNKEGTLHSSSHSEKSRM
mmetsp:Transcript_84272/g.133103  ORF Transcript_84272/g.133103 Transcript_84272/m.133103 type:complete len:85 (+) Transcript_84272:1188-1442(+)